MGIQDLTGHAESEDAAGNIRFYPLLGYGTQEPAGGYGWYRTEGELTTTATCLGIHS